MSSPDYPVQTALKPDETQPWTSHGDKITPLARYDVKARIMHRETYWADRWADLVPIDFALGWQDMSQPSVYDQLDIQQNGRWYYYHWTDPLPIPVDAIISESANTHIIPGSDAVREKVLSFRAGELVELSGYLVRVDCPDGWHYISSLSRTDSGNGSCELMWVGKAVIVGR